MGRNWAEAGEKEGIDFIGAGQEGRTGGAENGQSLPPTLRLLSAELRRQLLDKWNHPKKIAVSEIAFGSQ